MDTDNLAWVEWMIEQRGVKGWSQSELARRAGVTRQTINDYESMRRLDPDQKILVKISQALGFPPDHLPRLVGNLPPAIGSDPWLEKQNYKLSLITDPALRETAERLINSLAEQEEAAAKSRPRTVFVGKRTQKELWKYLLGRPQMKNDPLFLSTSGRRMSADGIKHLVRRISLRAGVPAHPHSFRHTFAIEYLRNNGDVFTLQRLLGHSSLEMVRYYLALANSDMVAAHRRASPVDHWRL